VARLSAELAQLEREAAGGKQVSAAQRTKAEQALTKRDYGVENPGASATTVFTRRSETRTAP
jgi:hypothetical protein